MSVLIGPSPLLPCSYGRQSTERGPGGRSVRVLRTSRRDSSPAIQVPDL